MLTNEQQLVIDTITSNNLDKIVAVNACAGSGKTSTSVAVTEAFKGKNIFYTAFNRAIVQDSAKRFKPNVDARTIHSLAYRAIKNRRTPEELNYLTITEDLPYEDKAIIIKILDDFFRSASVDIDEFAELHTKDPALQELIAIYANKMLDGEIPPTFNYMLKCLHLMLLNKEIEIDFDLLILDECQDTTAVTLEIFKLINAKAKMMLGDTYQNIYSFMNTVNAFEELTNVNLLKLTKSFRCNDLIASTVEEYGRKYLEQDFIYSGTDTIQKDDTFKVAYITRTNAMLIERMYKLLEKNQSFTLTRQVNEIFSLPIALLNAAQGRPVYDKKYKYLEKEYKNYLTVKNHYRSYYEYIISITEDALLENIIKMLLNFSQKRINLYDIKEKTTDMLINNPNKNIILTTAHAFKGLEMDNVYIEDDLNYSVNRTISKMKELESFMNSGAFLDTNGKTVKNFLSKEQKEDLNTYYVALSRAKTNLINTGYIG